MCFEQHRRHMLISTQTKPVIVPEGRRDLPGCLPWRLHKTVKDWRLWHGTAAHPLTCALVRTMGTICSMTMVYSLGPSRACRGVGAARTGTTPAKPDWNEPVCSTAGMSRKIAG